MKQQILNDLQELDFENMDMYFFYIKDLVKNNENIGVEVISQVQCFIDDLENIKSGLLEVKKKKK